MLTKRKNPKAEAKRQNNEIDETSEYQKAKIKKMRLRHDEAVGLNLRFISMIISLGLPALASHFLIGKGAPLESLFLWLHAQKANELALSARATMKSIGLRDEELDKEVIIKQVIEDAYKIAEYVDPSYPVPVENPIDLYDVMAKKLDEMTPHQPENIINNYKEGYAGTLNGLGKLLFNTPGFKEFFSVEYKQMLNREELSYVKLAINFDLVKKTSFSDLAKLINFAYVNFNNHHLERMADRKYKSVNDLVKSTSAEIALTSTNYMFMWIFVLSSVLFTRFVIDFSVKSVYNKYLKSDTPTSIESLEANTNQLLNRYKQGMQGMLVFMLAALLYSFNQIRTQEKESPALYVFILNTLITIAIDFKYFKRLAQDEWAERQLKNEFKEILNYFNEAVAGTQTKWILERYKKLAILTFSADIEHNPKPRKANEIVRRVLLQHNIHAVSENNGSTLCIDARLPSVDPQSINNQIKIALDALNQDVESKEPPIEPRVTRYQQKKMKAKHFFNSAKPEVKSNCPVKRVIKLPNDLANQGHLIECENGSRFFIRKPDPKSSAVTQYDIDDLLGDRGMDVARKCGQSGIKLSTDGTMVFKNPKSRKRIRLEESGQIRVTVSDYNDDNNNEEKYQQVPAYTPAELYVKRR